MLYFIQIYARLRSSSFFFLLFMLCTDFLMHMYTYVYVHVCVCVCVCVCRVCVCVCMCVCVRVRHGYRDVWDMKWAEDNDEMLCVMEKTKMVILVGETADDPVVSSGYLARFRCHTETFNNQVLNIHTHT